MNCNRARSLYSGLGGAMLRGSKKALACLEAMAVASSAEMAGRASGLPSEEIWTGILRWRTGEVMVVEGG